MRASRRNAQVGLEDALELEDGFVVEADVGRARRLECLRLGGNSGPRWLGKGRVTPFSRVKRSSCAAATIGAVASRHAALS